MFPEKRYDILKYLPSTGPMYIPIPGTGDECYSEGYAVKFYKDDGSDWVANFRSGWGELNTVIEMPDKVHLLVVAYGHCYIMNPNNAEPLDTFGYSYGQLLRSPDGKLILYGYNDITIFHQDGSHDDLNIYFDGIRQVSIENNILTGQTYDYTDIWTPFEYNLNTKDLKVIGGNWTYQPENTTTQLSKKPWWKFW